MLKKLVKKTLWRLTGGYKPKEFWDRWSKSFMDDPWQVQTHEQHDWLLAKVKQATPKNILEVGCGFGRNLVFLLENKIAPDKITGVDISPKMIEKAKAYIRHNTVSLAVARADDLPFRNREFDVTIVHGVFMHIKPQNIGKSVKEVIRVTKKYLICIEQNYQADNDYTFVHDYKKLYAANGAKIEEYVHNTQSGLDYFYVKVR